MSFSDAWKKAGQPADDFDPPDGHYHIEILDGSAFEGNDGRQWAKLTLHITQGEHAGRDFTDFMNLNNEVGLRIARQNLDLYGIKADQIEDLQDLDTAMLELTGVQAAVTVKHSSGGFLNVTVASAKTGPSDVPNGQEAFNVGDEKPKVGARYGQSPDDEDEIPFHHADPPAWEDRYAR